MKKIFSMIAVFAAIAVSHNVSAQNPDLMYEGTKELDAVGVISGSPSIFNEKGIACSLTYDFSQAHIVNFDRDNKTVIKDFGSIDDYNTSHGEDFVRDWPECLMQLVVNTCIQMNKKLKVEFYPEVHEIPEISDIPEFANVEKKYDVVIKLALFDMGHFVAVGSVKAGGNIAKGIMYVYEHGTQNVVAAFDLNYLRGNNVGYGDRDRLRQYGKNLAKAMAALAK